MPGVSLAARFLTDAINAASKISTAHTANFSNKAKKKKKDLKMDPGTFEKKVKQGLEKLNMEQAVHFTWLCSVRTLPFMGSDGNIQGINDFK